MIKIYKGCFFIYRVSVALLIVLLLLNNTVAGGPKHNIDYDLPDILLIIFGLITLTFTWLLYRPGLSEASRTVVRYAVSAFVFASIFFEIYFLYYTFFICACFSGGHILITGLLLLFTLITVVSFLGLAKSSL